MNEVYDMPKKGVDGDKLYSWGILGNDTDLTCILEEGFLVGEVNDGFNGTIN